MAAGVDLNGREQNGVAPLAIAASIRNTTAAAFLIDHGASIDILDEDGDSPLNASIHSHSDDMMQLLLSRGANYTLWDSNGDSVLHLAAKCGGIRTLAILLEAELYGLDPDAHNREGKIALQVAQEREGNPEGFVEKMAELLASIRIRNADIKHSRQEDSSRPKEATAIYQRFNFLQRFLCMSRLDWIRGVENDPRAPLKQQPPVSSIRYWIFGLCFVGLTCFWMYLELGFVMRLFSLVWEMFDPGEFEHF